MSWDHLDAEIRAEFAAQDAENAAPKEDLGPLIRALRRTIGPIEARMLRIQRKMAQHRRERVK